MITALLCGAGAGAGLVAVVRGLRPPRPDLAASLEALRPGPEPPPPLVSGDEPGWAARAGRPLAGVLVGLGLPTAGVRRDLAVLGRSPERHLAEKATAGVAGLAAAPVLTATVALAGGGESVLIVAWMSLVLAAIGFLAPDVQVKTAAARARVDFRYALSAFLDLTVVSLAGGAGVDGALTDAAAVGRGWAFTQIRAALEAARLSREPPWGHLGRLGDELGVTELTELATTVALAGTEGAKVRQSLSTKAAALRAHQIAEAETQAQSASERMSLPVVLLFAGFLVFIGYPAVTQVLTGL